MRSPLRLAASPAPWLALAYLGRSLVAGAMSFTVVTTLLVTTGLLSIMWLGLPLLLAALAVVRGLTRLERRRLTLVRRPRLSPPYDPEPATGVPARLRARLRDRATWRDIVLLVPLWPVLFVLDAVALAVWLALAALVSVPVWYRYVQQDFADGTRTHGLRFGYFPHGPHGPGGWGVFVGDLPVALAAAATGAALLVLAGNYAVVAAARTHAAIAHALLRPWRDPLAEARAMLAGDPELAGAG